MTDKLYSEVNYAYGGRGVECPLGLGREPGVTEESSARQGLARSYDVVYVLHFLPVISSFQLVLMRKENLGFSAIR